MPVKLFTAPRHDKLGTFAKIIALIITIPVFS